MADNFSGVSLAFDKASYNPGDLMTVTVAGSAVATVAGQAPINISALVTSADGDSTIISPPPASENEPTTQNEPVKITSINDPSGRVWTISADGLSATATA